MHRLPLHFNSMSRTPVFPEVQRDSKKEQMEKTETLVSFGKRTADLTRRCCPDDSQKADKRNKDAATGSGTK